MKSIFLFGKDITEGSSKDINILGGKGANLAEMCNIKLPVPPGFTISTDVCNYYLEHNKYPNSFEKEVEVAIKKIELCKKQVFGDEKNPLLLSIRSGARQSMPGMMETVLNIGLTENTILGLINKTNNERFVYDSYRRLIMMYADVVMEKSKNSNLTNGEGIRKQLEQKLEEYKIQNDILNDSELNVADLKYIISTFKKIVYKNFNENFPDNPNTQLWGAINAVFRSWNGKRAKQYRKIENIPSDWGTAVNVQSMVFGNLGSQSATGVAFTRNPSNGINQIYGEWLENAQGEDVVAGIRTPKPINCHSQSKQTKNSDTLENTFPKIYKKLNKIKHQLEKHYIDMQDVEFTIEDEKLWMLQTRTGKRTGEAAIKIATDMLNEKLINEKQCLLRIKEKNIDEIMHPKVDPRLELDVQYVAVGLPASPGGAIGKIVFSANDAEKWNAKGEKVILVRHETSPEDVQGMHVAQGILTAKGGMTSHAALVARGWGKPCVVGCSALHIDISKKKLVIGSEKYKEGDWFTINSTVGTIYDKKLKLIKPNFFENDSFKAIMKLSDKYRKMKVRTNADNKKDAQLAKKLGAEGIGLCRTEHMFFDKRRIRSVQKMILSDSKKERNDAIMELLPYQRKDFYNILKSMAPYPVTIRLLDPPLHEFLPSQKNNKIISTLSKDMGVSQKKIINRIIELFEINPMLGHRGCRLGITFPEITIMQSTAIFEATIKLIENGYKPFPEIMIPLIGTYKEFLHQKNIIEGVAKNIQQKSNIKFKFSIGTMIELPRACLTADQIAKEAEFFSFGTNDLTQTTFGFSRDDIGTFLPDYIEHNIIKEDPFQSLDVKGVGQLVEIGVSKGRTENKKLKIGICGEHGGDPKSVNFFNSIGLDYVSCSPFRVPIAILAAAKSEL